MQFDPLESRHERLKVIQSSARHVQTRSLTTLIIIYTTFHHVGCELDRLRSSLVPFDPS